MPIFWDRHGLPHSPSAASVIRNREGAFACCVHDDMLLLIQPWYAPSVPEMPGGGIDAGEDAIQANNREFQEETGFTAAFTPNGIEQTFTQDVRFYADDVQEYWHYRQHFFLITRGLTPFLFGGEKPTPESGIMGWAPVGGLKSLTLHTMHRKALVAFGLLQKPDGEN